MNYEEQNTTIDLEDSARHFKVDFAKPETTNDQADPNSIVDSIVQNKLPLPNWQAAEFIRDAKRRISESNLSILKGNKALYQVLADCYEQANQMPGDTDRLEAFKRCWNEAFKASFPSAPYFTAVMKLVLGEDDKKRSAYIKVLRAAAADKVTYAGFVAWVETQGGIEKIRLTNTGNGLTREDRLSEKLKEGQKFLDARQPLMINVPVSRTGVAKHREFVAYVRLEADGSYSQVWNCTDESVLDKLRLAAGKEFGTSGDQKSSADKKRDAVNTAVDNTPDE